MSEMFVRTPEIEYIWPKMGNSNLLVTGKAGTGKSFVIRKWLEEQRDRGAGTIPVMAPTGTAAVNIGGTTIHSFFAIPPGATHEDVQKIRYGEDRRDIFAMLQTIVIDEISMVRADLFDHMATLLRRYGPYPGQPLGGVKLLLTGDPYQLQPVVSQEDAVLVEKYHSPYFFHSEAWQDANFEPVQLTIPFRQAEGEFLSLLDAIRDGSATPVQIAQINNIAKQNIRSPDDPILATIRRTVQRYNQDGLAKIRGRSMTFNSESYGTFESVQEAQLPADKELMLKEGARVMILKNNLPAYFNGSTGTVLKLPDASDETPIVMIELDSGGVVPIVQHDWERCQYQKTTISDDGDEKDILQRIVTGRFRQFPLRLGYAVTIHKSQGMSLDRAMIDMGRRAFSSGQTYVALSRLRNQLGLTLERPIRQEDILVANSARDFMDSIQKIE